MVTFSGLRKVLIVVVCSQALTVFSQPFVQRPEQFKAHVNRIVDERHPFSEQLKQISRLYEQMYGDEKLVLIGRANDEVAGIFDATHETFLYS